MTPNARRPDDISPSTLRARLAKAPAPLLIDVRTNEEVQLARIQGSLHVPLTALRATIAEHAPSKETELIIYCASGKRSQTAREQLEASGYKRVTHVIGGIDAWIAKGYPTESTSALNQEQRERYSRHLLIPQVGEGGQSKLLRARVLLVGVGGLGSPIALYLAAAGVGTLGLIDDDVVDRSNLQRQIVHTDDRIGVAKVESAKRSLEALNPDVKVEAFRARLDQHNAEEIMRQGWDVIVDGGDNFATRYLVNDIAVKLGLPIVHGSIHRFDGQVTTFIPHHGPCYRCLYPDPPPAQFAPNCQEAGVLGVLPGIIGTLQATETLKLILGIGETLSGRLMTVDALSMRFRELRLGRDPACLACGEHANLDTLVQYVESCSTT